MQQLMIRALHNIPSELLTGFEERYMFEPTTKLVCDGIRNTISREIDQDSRLDSKRWEYISGCPPRQDVNIYFDGLTESDSCHCLVSDQIYGNDSHRLRLPTTNRVLKTQKYSLLQIQMYGSFGHHSQWQSLGIHVGCSLNDVSTTMCPLGSVDSRLQIRVP